MKFTRTQYLLLAGLIVLAALSFSRSPARANVLGEIWQNLLAPFSASPHADTIQAQNVPPQNTLPYQPVLDYERAVINAVKKASPSVVAITVSKNVPILENCRGNAYLDLPPELREFFGEEFPDFPSQCEQGTRLQEVGGGSGFFVSSDGLVLTNKHVVSDTQASYTVFTNDGRKFEARVLARDPLQDLALIKINGSGFPTVALGDSNNIELGQSVIAIGNALGEFRNTVSVGVVSGLARTVTAAGRNGRPEIIQGVIQTDAAINPGNSGGPLLNLRGEVIAINTAIVSGAQNIGFAIPINRAIRDIESVVRSGEIQVPFLGVRYIAVTPEVARAESLPTEYGALVQGGDGQPAVTPGSPAARAGIQEGDLILELDGQRIDPDHSLGDLISQRTVGESVSLRIRRGDREFSTSVELAKRP